MPWSTIEILGKRIDLYHPPTPARGQLVWLHDEDGMTPFEEPTFTALLDQHRLFCACPHAGPVWWVDRPHPAFDPRLSAERFVVEHVPRSDGKTAIAGIGMGGQGALRLAFRHATTFPVVAALNAAVDFHERIGRLPTLLDEMYDSREHARQDTATLQVRQVGAPPHVWLGCDPASEWYRGNDRLHEKLSAVGVAHTAEFRPPRLSEAMAWLASALDQESRRLL